MIKLSTALAVFFCAALFTAPAFAQVPKAPANPESPEYHTCNDTTDCAAVNPPCGNLLAFNREHAAEMQAWYDYVRPRFECGSAPQNTNESPVCSPAHRCMMAPPGASVPARDNPAYCDQAEDCVTVTGTCGRLGFSNKMNEQQTQAKLGDPNAQVGCDYQETRIPTNLRCEEHLCKADLVNQLPESQQPEGDPSQFPQGSGEPPPTDNPAPQDNTQDSPVAP